MGNTLRTADAKNRAWRTFAQGLGIDVAVGVALILGTYFMDKEAWGEVQWAILGFSVFKSVVQAVAAYVMRTFVDRKTSAFLPPAVPGPPVNPDLPGEDGAGELNLVVRVLVILVVIAALVWVLSLLL